MRFTTIVCWVGAVAACLLAGSPARAADVGGTARDSDCAQGISLALRGDLAHAEAVFRTMLNRAPRDPRALNNLGNIYLMRGQPRMALGSYRVAMLQDPRDPGIRLNEASAYHFLGEDTAQALMRAAIHRAGGLENAARLLGIHMPRQASPEVRGAERPRANRDEIQQLLLRAAATVPSRAPAADSARKSGQRRAESGRVSVPGGTRAADLASPDDSSAVESALYWKR